MVDIWDMNAHYQIRYLDVEESSSDDDTTHQQLFKDIEPMKLEDVDEYHKHSSELKDFIFGVFSSSGLLFLMLIEVVKLIFAGHINDSSVVKGVGLGNTLINVSCFSVWMGINRATEIFISKSFKNIHDYYWECLLNKGRISQAILFIPQVVFLIFSKKILMWWGQEDAPSQIAETYIFALVPGLFAMTQFETSWKYLRAMTIFRPQMYIQWAAILIHIILSYLLAFTIELGLTGVSISTSLVFWISLIAITGYLWWNNDVFPENSWHSFNWNSFNNYDQFWKYSIASIIILWLVWSWFEIITTFVYMLGTIEITASVVIFNIWFLSQAPAVTFFWIPSRVRDKINGEASNCAKRYLFKSLLFVLALNIIILVFHIFIPLIYHQNKIANALVSKTLLFFWLVIFFEYSKAEKSGSLIYCDLKNYGRSVIFIIFWVAEALILHLFTLLFDINWKSLLLGEAFVITIAALIYMILTFMRSSIKLLNEIMCQSRYEESPLKLPLLL